MRENEFFKIVMDLLGNQNKKYLVKCGNGEDKYLNENTVRGNFVLDTSEEFGYYKARFKVDEIIEIIKKDPIYLDWSRVKFEEVKDDGQNENE